MNDINTVLSDPVWKWMSFKVVLFSLYGVIFVLASVGNYLVVFVVVRNKSMQTITNIFITNLALADILTTTIAIPFTPFGVYMDEWIFPGFLCKLLPMTMALSVYVSTLTSTAIALDRYIVIVHPFIPRMKMKVCLCIVFVIWIVGSLITSPFAIFTRKVLSNNTNMMECREEWETTTSRKIFSSFNFVMQFILPGMIISLCYFCVGKVLKMRGANKIGCGVKSREREEMEVKRKRRTNQMLIAMVTIFILCWTPLNLLWILTEVCNLSSTLFGEYFTVIFLCAHLTAMSGTMYNPLLYGWMNKNFRQEFKRILPCLKITELVPTTVCAEDNTHFTRGSIANPTMMLQPRPSIQCVDPNKSSLLQVPNTKCYNGRYKISSL